MEGATVLLIFLALGYFLPTVIALARGHHSKAAIIALNVILGWTALGWLFAFIWSLTGVRRADAR